MTALFHIDETCPEDYFPDPSSALNEPNGLLAVGGELTPQRIYAAYCQGIFPWFNADEPPLWWSPDPRCVFDVREIQPNRRMLKYLRNGDYRVTRNQAFREVMQACAQTREDTWIQPEMIEAYSQLALEGKALSFEIWQKNTLVGGLFGIRTPHVFCGDSMFSKANNASKIAFYHLVEYCKLNNIEWIDGQVTSEHLLRLGAFEQPRRVFLANIKG